MLSLNSAGRSISEVRRFRPVVAELEPVVAELELQDWANPILQRPYEVKVGRLHMPDVPGVGLEWDEKGVAAHLVDNF